MGEVSWDQRWVVDHLPGTVIDCFASEVTGGPGGCALNSAMGVAFLGYPVELMGNKIDKNLHGPKIIARLKEKGVTAHLSPSEKIETPLCQIFVDAATGQRCFALNHKDIGHFDETHLWGLASRAAAGEFSVVFIQCYPRPLAKAFLTTATFPANTFTITQDITPDDPLVALFDMVQISKDEAVELSMDEIQQLGARYHSGRCRYLLVTHGSRGAYLVSKDLQPLFRPAIPVGIPVDTTGCGDAFRAGFMTALARGLSQAEALAEASKAGAHKAIVAGSFL